MDGGLVVELCQDISPLSGAMDFNWSVSAVEDLWSTLRDENDWLLQSNLKEADKYVVQTKYGDKNMVLCCLIKLPY